MHCRKCRSCHTQTRPTVSEKLQQKPIESSTVGRLQKQLRWATKSSTCANCNQHSKAIRIESKLSL